MAPDWTLSSSDGKSVEFHRDARGAPAVLFFWASWCPHCGAALPYMEALYQEFAPRGVRFYAMNIWEDGDAVAYFARHGYHLPLFLAADLVAEDYGVQGTPAVIVIDRGMRIADLNIDGAAPDEIAASLRLYLNATLKRKQTVTAR
jgi:thiol-disulfide isomerase/thioredoxin